ncbi:hypothetical protein TpMuguga_03g00181 [Theileria parva strain Muguga]|uniref:Uncharacterized protein n=1 Tax=Theileria parva TaxID=5875 RepID=Q4N0G3_THEPA|nr:uncharacterized protein TpMuguga_03g00181 [Theileria parva strain Muguga]EAN30916.1 hypothetical protein TpMuguga_03g00181 [Theileria parva strain Muguga]|eukprot:XP_763199.1 hypothetical protein [Theileria parva strain Muguga]
MEISRVFILNIISVILIKGCLNIKGEFPRNPLDSTTKSNYYKSLDLSVKDSLEAINLVKSEINDVDTILLFPKKGYKIGKLLISNEVIWVGKTGQHLLFATLSSNPNSKFLLINITVNGTRQLSNVMILGKNGIYEQIPTFQFMDYLAELRIRAEPKNFVLDLDSSHIPEVVDHTVRLGSILAAVFIPHRGYKATKIILGGQTVFDAKDSNLHVPIAMGYEHKRNSYLNFIAVDGTNNFGYIYQYNVSDNQIKFITKSDVKFIHQVFTFHVEDFINHRVSFDPLKERGSGIDIEDSHLSRLTFDIHNINNDLFKVQKVSVLNLETFKYTPIKGLIKSVVYNTKPIWHSNSRELSCKEVMIHYSNKLQHSVELKILLSTDAIDTRIIPYKSILMDDTSLATDGPLEFKPPVMKTPVPKKLRRSRSLPDIQVKEVENKPEEERTPPNTPTCSREDLGTPPNSPARNTEEDVGTPPNSPARTPPPSPTRSPSNSLTSDDQVPHINKVEDDDSRLYVLDSNDKPITDDYFDDYYDDYLDDYLDDMFDDEEFEGEYLVSGLHDSDSISHHIHPDEFPYIDEEPIIPKDDSAHDQVDISSRKSMEKMYIIDGTKYVPFIFLLAYEDRPIRAVSDGPDVIWEAENNKQLLRYATLYLYDNKPVALALFIIDRPTFRQRYYVKEDDRWYEVDIYEYKIKTPYEIKGKKDYNEEDKLITEETPKAVKSVLHVSPMFPVVLGTIFVFVSVSSLLFILFFC